MSCKFRKRNSTSCHSLRSSFIDITHDVVCNIYASALPQDLEVSIMAMPDVDRLLCQSIDRRQAANGLAIIIANEEGCYPDYKRLEGA